MSADKDEMDDMADLRFELEAMRERAEKAEAQRLDGYIAGEAAQREETFAAIARHQQALAMVAVLEVDIAAERAKRDGLLAALKQMVSVVGSQSADGPDDGSIVALAVAMDAIAAAEAAP